MTDTTTYNVVFCTRTARIIDVVHKDADTKQLIASLSVSYGPDLIILGNVEANNRYEAQFKSDPVEISEQKFTELLEILPPAAWQTDHNGESFKMVERTAGAITSIQVRIGARFVSFSDDIRTPHEECCRRAAAFLIKAPAQTHLNSNN